MVLPLDGYRRPACSLAVAALPGAICAIVIVYGLSPSCNRTPVDLLLSVAIRVCSAFTPLGVSGWLVGAWELSGRGEPANSTILELQFDVGILTLTLTLRYAFGPWKTALCKPEHSRAKATASYL